LVGGPAEIARDFGVSGVAAKDGFGIGESRLAEKQARGLERFRGVQWTDSQLNAKRWNEESASRPGDPGCGIYRLNVGKVGGPIGATILLQTPPKS